MNAATGAILALYLPIVVMGGLATLLLLTRLVIPAWRNRMLDLDRYSLGLGAMFAMMAHACENMLYGAARWFPVLKHLLLDPSFAVAGKLMIVCSVIFTLAGIVGGRGVRMMLLKLALLLWCVAFAVALALFD